MLLADDGVKARVSLCEPVQRPVVGEGRAYEHDVVELTAEVPQSWLTRNCVLPEFVGPKISALKGMMSGSIFLILHFIQLVSKNVELCVSDHEHLAVNGP